MSSKVAELSPADRARQTARRKAIYLELHPETAEYVAGAHGSNSAQGNAAAKLAPAFSADTAKATGQSERTVQRDAERGEKVDCASYSLTLLLTLRSGFAHPASHYAAHGSIRFAHPASHSPYYVGACARAWGARRSPKSLRSAYPMKGASKSLGECKTSTGADLKFPQNRINCLSWSICNSVFREDFCGLQPNCIPKIAFAEVQNRGLFR